MALEIIQVLIPIFTVSIMLADTCHRLEILVSFLDLWCSEIVTYKKNIKFSQQKAIATKLHTLHIKSTKLGFCCMIKDLSLQILMEQQKLEGIGFFTFNFELLKSVKIFCSVFFQKLMLKFQYMYF